MNKPFANLIPENSHPPGPPDSLRGRVMKAVSEALTGSEKPDFWTVLWLNPVVRIAWVICMIFLLTGHLFLNLMIKERHTGDVVPIQAKRGEGQGFEIIGLAERIKINSGLLPAAGFTETHLNHPVHGEKSGEIILTGKETL